jgi:hypothetical protein
MCGTRPFSFAISRRKSAAEIAGFVARFGGQATS